MYYFVLVTAPLTAPKGTSKGNSVNIGQNYDNILEKRVREGQVSIVNIK